MMASLGARRLVSASRKFSRSLGAHAVFPGMGSSGFKVSQFRHFAASGFKFPPDEPENTQANFLRRRHFLRVMAEQAEKEPYSPFKRGHCSECGLVEDACQCWRNSQSLSSEFSEEIASNEFSTEWDKVEKHIGQEHVVYGWSNCRICNKNFSMCKCDFSFFEKELEKYEQEHGTVDVEKDDQGDFLQRWKNILQDQEKYILEAEFSDEDNETASTDELLEIAQNIINVSHQPIPEDRQKWIFSEIKSGKQPKQILEEIRSTSSEAERKEMDNISETFGLASPEEFDHFKSAMLFALRKMEGASESQLEQLSSHFTAGTHVERLSEAEQEDFCNNRMKELQSDEKFHKLIENLIPSDEEIDRLVFKMFPNVSPESIKSDRDSQETTPAKTQNISFDEFLAQNKNKNPNDLDLFGSYDIGDDNDDLNLAGKDDWNTDDSYGLQAANADDIEKMLDEDYAEFQSIVDDEDIDSSAASSSGLDATRILATPDDQLDELDLEFKKAVLGGLEREVVDGVTGAPPIKKPHYYDRVERKTSTLPPTAKIIERKVDHKGKSWAMGKRKQSTARAFVWKAKDPSKSQIIINQKDYIDYIGPSMKRRLDFCTPFLLTNTMGMYNVRAMVSGGGSTSQVEAVRLAIARALQLNDPNLRHTLRKNFMLTPDGRFKEAKKIGRRKARKSQQWSKR